MRIVVSEFGTWAFLLHCSSKKVNIEIGNKNILPLNNSHLLILKKYSNCFLLGCFVINGAVHNVHVKL